MLFYRGVVSLSGEYCLDNYSNKPMHFREEIEFGVAVKGVVLVHADD